MLVLYAALALGLSLLGIGIAIFKEPFNRFVEQLRKRSALGFPTTPGKLHP